MTKAEKIILKTIRELKLREGVGVLIALSGGADSAALLCAMHNINSAFGFKLYACHVNHMIRGGEADHDEEFSRQLCGALSVPFFSKKINVPLMAKNEHLSEETAGRKARYAYFDEIMKNNNIDYLATAHHRDDRTETILMNIIRGSGARGFKGIEYKNGNIIRPMLDLSKKDILSYCSENNIDYCTDSTNTDENYLRNKVRRRLIPLLEEINPSAASSIIRMSDIISSDDDYLDALAKSELKKMISPRGLKTSALNSMHMSLKRRVVFEYYADIKGSADDISFEAVDSMLTLARGNSGKRISLGGGYTAAVSYGYLKIFKYEANLSFEYTLKINEPCFVAEIGKTFVLRESTGKSRDTFSFSGTESFVLRSRRSGDYLYPVGMMGKKKLKELFIDKKLDRALRERVPVLTADGEIACVFGIRNDRRFWSEKGNYELVCTDG